MAKKSDYLSSYDIHLFSEGTHYRTWEKLGAHLGDKKGKNGCWFAVWAPNAERVSVIGEFNQWDKEIDPLERRGESGIWEGFVPDVSPGALYKYAITSKFQGYNVEKGDPFAFACEIRPQTASMVWELDGYEWGDAEWMQYRYKNNGLEAPISIYEVHLGSWMRHKEDNRWLSYREMAPILAVYVKDMGFTHVEFLPVCEHPFDGSWGYQTIGYFAPTSRFGNPQDFMFLVDTLHQHGIGVILDWVPAHFPKDGHGIGYFDGTHVYEHADPRQGEHQDWGTFIFNYGRKEVANFLLANALFWLEIYHIDGLRVDAVASMLYLDYSRKQGEWIPNKYGGRDNLEALEFLKRLNELVYREHPDTFTVAEESTSWPMVSRPLYVGGLGFGFKWNMGWMHDMLRYMREDPIHRKYYHNNLIFSLYYAFTENFILPFSHDDVVHGKGSLIGKMVGDEWQKFANLRLLYGYMYTHPGKKLLFMGCEFGQWSEWNHDRQLDWDLLDFPRHAGLQRLVRDLNGLLRRTPALYQRDFSPEGFSWIDCQDYEKSIISFLRFSGEPDETMACICNFTPVSHYDYRIGLPRAGLWQEVLNSDSAYYGGSGIGNFGEVSAEPIKKHGLDFSAKLVLPPLAIIVLQPRSPKKADDELPDDNP